MRHLHRPQVRTACFALWCVSWLVVSALLLTPLKAPPVPGSDLVAHFTLFGLMALGAVTFCRHPLPLGLCAALTVSAGAALEYAQGLVPSRMFDLADLLANTLGGLTGYALALFVLYVFIRPAAPELADAPAQGF